MAALRRTDRDQRRPENAEALGTQHRRQADPGRLALPLLRGQPRARVRPRSGAWHAPRRSRRAVDPLRGRRRARPRPGRAWRQQARDRLQQARRRRPTAMSSVARQTYASLYGPTAGDRFRLADTSLIAQVEQSLVLPSDEAVYGRGKVIRDGMGQIPGRRNADDVLDLVIT